jgi:ABC-type nitrate/sulfonate/bicarbonate transport system substrate-binding protein
VPKLKTAAMLVASGLLLACAMATGKAADVVKVHMPAASMESMPYLLAKELGFYRENGIEFQENILNTDVGVVATVAGNLDATQILGLSLRGAIEQGFDLKIVMIFNKLPTYSLYVGKDISSYKDLKGSKIGSTSSGASATRALKERLIENGVDPEKDVAIFYIGAIPTIYQALVSGTVAGGILLTPFDLSAEDRGFRALPFTDRPGMLTGGVAVAGKFLRERPDVARRFLQATWRGLRTLKTDRATSIAIIAKSMKIVEPDRAGRIYDRWVDRFSSDGVEDKSYIDQVLTFEFGKATEAQAHKAFDFSIVESFNKH